MAKLIKKIRTEDGDLQIDYTALANLPTSDTTLSIEGAFADAKATGDRIEETNTKIDDLINGTTTAPAMSVTDLEAESFSLNNNPVDSYDLTMGSVASGKVLSTQGAINLAHSHAVIVNDDGTITLGEVSSKGGNFKIADTKAYKDGVSAAIDSVTLSAGGWIDRDNIVTASNGKSVTVSLPTFSVSGGASFDSENKTTVSFSTPSVSTPLKTMEVDASSVYNVGYEAGVASAGDGSVATSVEIARDGDDSYDSSTHDTDIHVKATTNNGVSSTQTFTVSGDDAYNAGYSAGYGSGPSSVTLSKSWSKGTLTVKASNGKTSTAILGKGTETWDGNTCSFPITDGGSSTGFTCSVDASSIYTSGKNSVTVPNANIVRQSADYYAGGDNHSTTVYIKATASNGAYGTQSFSVSGTSAYNAGHTSGLNSDNFDKFSVSGGTISISLLNGKTTSISVGTGEVDGSTTEIPVYATGDKLDHTLFTIDASNIYTSGQNSVTVPNARIVRQAADYYAGGADHSTTVYIKATASNGAYGTQSFSVSGEAAYKAGWGAAVAACKASRTDNTVTVVLPSSTVGSTTTETFTASASISGHSDSYTASSLYINGSSTSTGGYYTNAQVSYTPSSHSHKTGSAVISWS